MALLAAASVASALAFTPMTAPPLLSSRPLATRLHASPRMLDASALATIPSMLVADQGGSFLQDTNLVFLLLGAIPFVAIGAFTLVSGSEKKLQEIRNDPANESRLGYTAEEVNKMEELMRLRYESSLKDYNEAVAEAEKNGTQKPNGLTWLADKAAKKGDYFDGLGSNESPTMI